MGITGISFKLSGHISTRATLTAWAVALACICSQPYATAWVDPTTGKDYATRVTRPADIPKRNWLPGHRGVDLYLQPGAPVLAAEAGTVAFVGSVAGTPIVSVDHAPSARFPEGIRTTYQPVRASVAVGDEVAEGQVIGVLARATSRFAGEHDGLHWGAKTGPDTYIDPLTLLEPPKIRLKPVERAARVRR